MKAIAQSTIPIVTKCKQMNDSNYDIDTLRHTLREQLQQEIDCQKT